MRCKKVIYAWNGNIYTGMENNTHLGCLAPFFFHAQEIPKNVPCLFLTFPLFRRRSFGFLPVTTDRSELTMNVLNFYLWASTHCSSHCISSLSPPIRGRKTSDTNFFAPTAEFDTCVYASIPRLYGIDGSGITHKLIS